MVVLRDMFNGKKRYSEFLASPEAISTNVLADRLSMMEQDGLITAVPYQEKPMRLEYVLSEKGMGLLPVLQALCRWGNTYLPGTYVPPASFMERKLP